MNLIEKVEARKFGFIVGSIFIILGLLSAFKDKGINLSLIIPASILFLLALIAPGLLVPIYKAWMRLGAILGRINSFLILSIIFYCVVTPIGLIRRIFSKGSEKFAYKTAKDSYWINRASNNPAEDMKRMF
ncbi:MAG: SxtJ family membrane protein [Nitrospirota bacterium]